MFFSIAQRAWLRAARQERNSLIHRAARPISRPFFACSSKAVFRLLLLAALGYGQDITPPSIPSAGENKLPLNTRVIEGVVVDSKGVPVPNAIVLLKDTKSLQIRSYVAQRDGNYRFFGLSTDVNYQVRAHNGDMTSPWKLVSVFNSRQRVKVELKLKKKFDPKKVSKFLP